MTSLNNTAILNAPSTETDDTEIYALLGMLTIFVINATMAFFLLFTILLKSRSRRPIFYLNVLMLVLTFTLSLVNIPTTWRIIIIRDVQLADISLIVIGVDVILFCSIKIVAEVILILRLRALYPQMAILIVCISLVLLRTTCQTLGIICSIFYPQYGWLTAVEAFLTAVNNIFFSSAFILTLISRMREVRRSIGDLRNHRLFFFLIFAIENMVVPCITSLSLAIFILFVGDNTIFLTYVFSLVVGNICVTVASIVMTALLGTTSGSQIHYLPYITNGVGRAPKNSTPMQIMPSVKNSRIVEDEEVAELASAY